MYYLHHLSGHFIGFNVFLYVTFRAIAAAVTSFLTTLLFGNFIIAKLRALKLGQPIRGAEEVHRLAELHGVKQGTPTMGGVLVIGAVFVSSILWARLDNKFVWLTLFSMVYLGGLGFADDYLKVTKKKSEGIHGRVKLLFQIILAAIITGLFLTDPLLEVQARALYVPFVKAPAIANMSWFTFFFFALVIVDWLHYHRGLCIRAALLRGGQFPRRRIFAGAVLSVCWGTDSCLLGADRRGLGLSVVQLLSG
jgi:phospho-N-acetylmuramoyl-pentapeptide-transferase